MSRHRPSATSAPLPPLTVATLPAPPGPPAPWTDWGEVRQVGADLTASRFLLVRRPEHLSAAEQGRLETLLASPLGADLRGARAFVTDWYAIWSDADGVRRDREAARIRWQRWREHPDYQAVAPLRRVQQQVDEARFERLSQFLRQPAWEATSNGAERMGRWPPISPAGGGMPNGGATSHAAPPGGLIPAWGEALHSAPKRRPATCGVGEAHVNYAVSILT